MAAKRAKCSLSRQAAAACMRSHGPVREPEALASFPSERSGPRWHREGSLMTASTYLLGCLLLSIVAGSRSSVWAPLDDPFASQPVNFRTRYNSTSSLYILQVFTRTSLLVTLSGSTGGANSSFAGKAFGA